MNQSLPHHRLIACVIGALTLAGGTAAATDDVQPPPPNGNFMSSIKQAFKQDLDHEVVRGHFDLGTPPDTHRYYCLIDPKTGRRESNGVGGEPVVRKDGMTGVKSGAVAFYSCVTAEQQGLLVTSGYVLSDAANAALAKSSPPPAPTTPVPPKMLPAAVVPSQAPADGAVQTDVMALFTRFIAAQNTHDRSAVAEVLLDSKDFVWVPSDGAPIWGHQDAMTAYERAWKGSWKLDPQLNEMHIGSLAAGAAVLITPVLSTEGAVGETPITAPVRWSGVFLKTSAGWRISAILVSPLTPRAQHN